MKASALGEETTMIGPAMPPGYREPGGDGEMDRETETLSPAMLLAKEVVKAVDDLRMGFEEAEAFVEKVC